MQIRNSKLCEASKCSVCSAVHHPWMMRMLFHRQGLAVAGSAVRYTCFLFIVMKGIYFYFSQKLFGKIYLDDKPLCSE